MKKGLNTVFSPGFFYYCPYDIFSSWKRPKIFYYCFYDLLISSSPTVHDWLGMTLLVQGMVDGSASMPALRQDTGFMVDKNLPWYSTIFGSFWGLFNASATQYGSKGVSIYKIDHWNVVVNSRYLPSGQKTISFGQKRPQQTI